VFSVPLVSHVAMDLTCCQGSDQDIKYHSTDRDQDLKPDAVTTVFKCGSQCGVVGMLVGVFI